MSNTANKISYLDGLRGVAAFLVFCHHFLLIFYPAYFSFAAGESNIKGLWDMRFGQSFWSVFANGNFCVYIFFVLSGYVLSRKYWATERTDLLISAANRRFIRLYIPVAFTICASFVMIKLGLFYNQEVCTLRKADIGWWWHFPNELNELRKALLYSSMFEGHNKFDVSLWTIGLEVSGSMFVFAFLALTNKIRNKNFVICVMLIYCYLTEQSYTASFFAGICLNFVVPVQNTKGRTLRGVSALLLLAFSLYLGDYPTMEGVSLKGTLFEHLGHTLQGYPNWFHMLGASLFVLSFMLSPRLQSIVNTKPLLFLGRISFSLYLIHPLLIGSLGCFTYLKIYQHSGFNMSTVYCFIITAIASILLSWLMTIYIDEKGIQLSKYIYQKWFKRQADSIEG